LGLPDPDSYIVKQSSVADPGCILTQEIVSKLSEIWFGMFIPDPDLDFYPSRIQGSKRHRIRNTEAEQSIKQIFVGIMKATEEKSWVRIRNPEVWIRGSGSVSKRHGSGKLNTRHYGSGTKHDGQWFFWTWQFFKWKK
jgi:hypothetical protein